MFQVSILIIDQFFRTLLRFLVGIIIARQCSNDYSYYVILQTFYIYALFLTTSIVISPYMVFVHKDEINSEEYNRMVSFIMLSMLVLVIIIFTGVYGIFFEGKYFNVIFFVLSLMVILSDVISNFIRMIFVAKIEYFYSAANSILSFLIFFAMFGILYFNNFIEIETVLLAIVIAYLIPSLLIWYYYLNRKKPPNELSYFIRTFKEHFKFGKWIFLTCILNLITNSSFPFILKILGQDSVIPLIGVCVGLFGLLNPVAILLQNIFAPRLVKSFNESVGKFRESLRKYFMLILAIFLPLFICILLIGNDLIEKLYGDVYSVPFIVILFWSMSRFFEVLASLFNAGVVVFERTKVIFVQSLVCFSIFIIFGIPMIIKLQLVGIALSLCVTKFIQSGMAVLVLKYYMDGCKLNR